MKMVDTMRWDDGGLYLLDQTLLPAETKFVRVDTYEEVCNAIKRLAVRGAPALGAAAAYAMVLGWRQLCASNKEQGTSLKDLLDAFAAVRDTIAAARPTAVNLSWGAGQLYAVAESEIKSICGSKENGVKFFNTAQAIEEKLLAAANDIYDNDICINKRIGEWGLTVLPGQAVVLTHCNAGALATCGYGTALGVIRAGHRYGKIKMVYCDETRPLLQGARLTTWELQQDYIPVTLITDGMAAWTMRQKGVNFVIVGADRIAANGDAANKIGTFGVALAARALGIPFYIAAPSMSFDFSLPCGEQIPIEEREPDEVRAYCGVRFAPARVNVFNPAFDVTPAELVTGFITEHGILRPPYTESIKKLQARAAACHGKAPVLKECGCRFN